MRVLYFHQHFTTRAGSTATRSYEMAQMLISRDHQVHIVCGSNEVAKSGLDGPYKNGKRSGLVDGITVTEFHIPYSNSDGLVKRTRAFLSFAFRSMWLALTEQYDIVFASTTPLTAGIPGIAAKLIRRKPFVFEVRDLWPELPKAMGVITNPAVLACMSALEWTSYRCANACIGLSPGIVEGIQRRSQKNKTIAMIPNGCDVDLFSSTTVSEPKPVFTAIFSGAHGVANGLDAVLDAAALLKTRGHEHIRFLFIGEGREKPRLMKRVVSEQLDCCEFRSAIPKTELVNLMQQVDVGLMILDNVPAFYFGTSPNKFFDYIAAGLPVLNNYPGWLASIIEEEQLGVVVPPESPEAFATALYDLSKDRSALVSMSTNSRNCAAKRFNRHVLAVQFSEFLESVLDKRSGQVVRV